MLIMEGVDHVGKTKLLKQIQRVLWNNGVPDNKHSKIQSFGVPGVEWDYLYDYLEKGFDGPQLSDRFVLSELAYGEVYRDGANSKFDDHSRRQIARMLNCTGSLSVYVHAEWDTVQRRLAKDPDDMVKTEGHYMDLHIVFQYNLINNIILGRPGIDYYVHEINTDDRHITKRQIEMILKDWSWRLNRAIEFSKMGSESWGSLSPRYLFVGSSARDYTFSIRNLTDAEVKEIKKQWEKRHKGLARIQVPILHGHKIIRKYYRPFLERTETNLAFSTLCGHFKEREIHIAPPYKTNGAVISLELLDFLSPKVIVAFGHEACEALDRIDVKHIKFQDPESIIKFESQRLEDYAGLLHKEVCRASYKNRKETL